MGVRPRGNDSIVTEWRFGGVLCERQATEAPFCALAAEDILRDVGGASSRAEAALSRRHGDSVEYYASVKPRKHPSARSPPRTCGASYGRQAARERLYRDRVTIRWVLRERQATEAPFCALAAEDILRDVGGRQAALKRPYRDGMAIHSPASPRAAQRSPSARPPQAGGTGGGSLHSRGGKGVEGSGAGLIFPAKTVMIEMERTRRPGCGMSGREGYRDGFFE